MNPIKGINFGSIVVAGVVAGYMMYFVDKMFAGFLGFFGMFPGTDNAWWMLTHHVDAVIFALPFAWTTIYNKLPGAGWFKGVVYGFFWWLVLLFVLGLVAGALGAQPFRQMSPGSASRFLNPLLLLFIGAVMCGSISQNGILQVKYAVNEAVEIAGIRGSPNWISADRFGMLKF
ncbi:MAG TPA: hypothetical protein VKA68_15875 [bacterium]|nr:hypothetical protein [bacterium]